VAKAFVEALQSAIGCVSAERFTTSLAANAENEVYSGRLRTPGRLRAAAGGPSGLFLDVAHDFSIIEVEHAGSRLRWRAITRSYEYRLLDHDHKELLVYHWQPGPRFLGPDHPHLHVSAALDARVDAVRRREIGLDTLHVVTGQVALDAVIRMLITDFEVAPQRHDWRQTLDRVEPLLREE
jgi:hypothetical protein